MTVTLHFRVLLFTFLAFLYFTVTFIVAFPAFFAVIFPLFATAATVLSDERNVFFVIFTDLDFLTFNDVDSPAVKVILVLDSDTGFAAAKEMAVLPPGNHTFDTTNATANALDRHLFPCVVFFMFPSFPVGIIPFSPTLCFFSYFSI